MDENKHIELASRYTLSVYDSISDIKRALTQVKIILRDMRIRGYIKHYAHHANNIQFLSLLEGGKRLIYMNRRLYNYWNDGVCFPLREKREYNRVIFNCNHDEKLVLELLNIAFKEGYLSAEPVKFIYHADVNQTFVSGYDTPTWLLNYWKDREVVPSVGTTTTSPSSKCTLEEARRLFSRR